MKIGMVGTGNVGTTLARAFAARGHDVMVGTRSPEQHRDLAPIRVGPVADAAAHGEVVFVAVAADALGDVVALIGPERLRRKVVVDTTNPLRFAGGRPVGLDVPPEGSAAQRLAALAPGARVVKAFNTVGYNLMVEPQLPGGPPDMFVCGDDAEAKATVAQLCAELKYPAFDCGPLTQAPLLESLAMLWISLAMQGKTRGHAFKLLRGT